MKFLIEQSENCFEDETTCYFRVNFVEVLATGGNLIRVCIDPLADF